MSDTAVLHPCPFCGSDDIRHDHPNRAPRVYCGRCRSTAENPEIWNQQVSGPLLLPHVENERLMREIEAQQDAKLATQRATIARLEVEVGRLREAYADALDTMQLLRADLFETDRESHAQRIGVLDLSIDIALAALEAGGEPPC